MSEATTNLLREEELSLTEAAQGKMAELVGQVEEEVKGIRVYASPGGCSGISFGMTFTDQLNDNDYVLNSTGFDVIVDGDTMRHLEGVQIDFVDQGNGNASFVFNNLKPAESSSGCGGCSSSAAQGGGCS
ncbi:HesB/IscA family protein [Sedimenticola selenatireducens]|uniref:Iron-sulfur cluster assembly accessory protein n=1 Tax=Sedimenticola selenatireducens TaxID=191960 RepID=A0A557S4Y9_9GAMM|nr:iron-sulfur cluster assembly accessory protein [Sedimenticola selenatireducens]TVO72465.1 iron-sulfur cluster assembly accessory protein [Sedimenticola selenatireducens]TVT64720.1 MAG: iron-sulfur cluster assembly accessory protein [Sedimenticola selenatireducens]